MFENRMLRRKDPRWMKWWEAGENCIMRSFIIRVIKSRKMRLVGHTALMQHKRNAYRIFV
jgi:hypothetical protein